MINRGRGGTSEALWRGRLPLCLALAFLAASGRPDPASAQDMTFHRIGTGAVGDTYFAIGGTIANVISNPPGARSCDRGGSCGVPGMIAIAQSTEGSVHNIEALASGTVDSALVQADVVYWAYHGSGQFRDRKALPQLRAISNLFPSTLHIVTLANSGIEDVSQLAGRRVSLGEQGSGTLVTARTILEANGISEAQIDPRFESPGAAVAALESREIDAFFLVGGVPVSVISELAQREQLRLLPITGTTGEEIRSFYPFFSDAYIASGAYHGIARTQTVGIGTQWVTTDKGSAELVHAITSALWHERGGTLFENGHPEGKRMSLDNALGGIAIPLHDGAAQFYREQGIER